MGAKELSELNGVLHPFRREHRARILWIPERV
jgi:hypothetical protein